MNDSEARRSGGTECAGTAKSFTGRLAAAAARLTAAFTKKEDVRGGGREKTDRGLAAVMNRVLTVATDPAKGVITGGVTALLASAAMPLGSHPLGLALMLAGERYVPYAYAGLLTAAVFSQNALRDAGVATAAFLLRTALSAWHSQSGGARRYAEPMSLRLAAGLFAALLGGLLRVISGGFLYYDLFGAAVELTSVAVAVPLFMGVTQPQRRYSARYEAGLAALLFAVVLALRPFHIFGFSLAIIAASLITMYISKTGGMTRGAVAGLLCGMGVGMEYSPALAVAGLASGLLWRVGGGVAVVISSAAALAVGTLSGGLPALKTLAPDIIVASAVFLPLNRFELLPRLGLYPPQEGMPDRVAGAFAVAQSQQREGEERLETLTKSLGELSEICYTISDRVRRPSPEEVRRLTAEVFRDNCRGCGRDRICWGGEYQSTADTMARITRILLSGQRMNLSALPERFTTRCPRADRIVGGASRAYSERIDEGIRCDKAEVFAADCAAISAYIKAAASEGESEYVIDEALTEAVREAAGQMDFYARSIAVYGARRIRVHAGGVEPSRLRVGAEDLRECFGAVCGVTFGAPEFNIDEGYMTMTLKAARSVRLECARRTLAAPGGESAVFEGDTEAPPAPARAKTVRGAECGDTAAYFESDDDRAFFLISDGMGSGEEAALTSRLSAAFLEKLLTAGGTKDSAVNMLSGFLRNRGLECSATIDLLAVDLLCGTASFVKSGAAPSYVLRDGSLYEITAQTMPVGIVRGMNAEEIRFELCVGDVVVMISDGVALSHEEDAWFSELLCGDWTDDLDTMCARITDAAQRHADERGVKRDDMSVALIRVCPAGRRKG